MGKRQNKGQEKKAQNLKRNGKQQKLHGPGSGIHKKVTPVQQHRQLGQPAKKQKKHVATGDASAKSEGSATMRVGLSSGMYSQTHRILLLGEGDFSFAAALALLWGDASFMVATAFDDEAATLSKYATASDNIETLRSLGASVAFGVDATRLDAAAAVVRQAKKGFDRIIFNFPCCRCNRISADP
jgi:25S rRNA (uracil2634-N3)-methyltransferase